MSLSSTGATWASGSGRVRHQTISVIVENRAGGGNQRKPDRPPLTGKGFGQSLNQILVGAAGRADGNSQRGWPGDQKGRAGDGGEQQQSGRENQKRRTVLSLPR